MRWMLLPFCLTVTPAAAWDVRLGPICELTHRLPGAEIRLTHDPSLPEYSITLRLDGAAWPDSPGFAIRFEGARPLTIGTDRHVLSEGGRALTVTDRGFGNVLDGLQFNRTAVALAGDRALSIPLDGAAEPVAAFRDCAPLPGV